MATARTLSINTKELTGDALVDAVAIIELADDEQTGSESVVISSVTSDPTDSNGDTSVTLLPNTVGSQNTSYRCKINNSSGNRVMDVTFRMPDNDADLHDLIASPSAATRTTYPDPVTFSDTATFATDVTFSGGTVDFTNATTVGLDVGGNFDPADYDGAGLIVSGGELAVGAGTGITVNADDVEIDASVVALLGGTNTFTGTVDLTGATVSLNSSDVSHDGTTGFVADEHVAHSSISITAGSGLTGGGTIDGNVTLNIGAGTGVTVNANDIAIGQDVATTAEVTFATVTPDETVIPETPDSDHTAIGVTTSALNAADSDIAIMDLVYLNSSSKWDEADATDTTAALGLLAIALEAGTIDTALKVAMPGSFVRDDSWSWTPGAQLYISTTTGAITATAPSSTDEVVRVIGYAITATVIWFQPSMDYGEV